MYYRFGDAAQLTPEQQLQLQMQQSQLLHTQQMQRDQMQHSQALSAQAHLAQQQLVAALQTTQAAEAAQAQAAMPFRAQMTMSPYMSIVKGSFKEYLAPALILLCLAGALGGLFLLFNQVKK